jgi:hypothetical protein
MKEEGGSSESLAGAKVSTVNIALTLKAADF